jgi:hypothetical protein
LSFLDDIAVKKSRLDEALKWADLIFKGFGTVAAICGIAVSVVIPVMLAREANRLQNNLAAQSTTLQQTIEKETSKREYVQMALNVLKENKGTDPRIRRLAAQIFVQNSPIQPLPEGLEDDLASGSTSFTFLSPQLAATGKGRAAQLAGEMFTLVVERAITLPKYMSNPKHTAVPPRISEDFKYKFYTLKEYDDDFAKEFHKRCDARINGALAGLEHDTNQLTTNQARKMCKAVGDVRSGGACASKIFEYSTFRNPG